MTETELYGAEQLVADLHEGRCPCHGCEETTAGARSYLMCGGHWRLVPSDQKREVYEAVHRVNGIAGRYEGADGAAQQGRLADLYFEAEIEMRECQLRAVIVASERAGARAEPIRSPAQSTPRKGGSMQIRIRSTDDGASAWIVDPSTGETVEGSTIELAPGQEVTITATTATNAGDLEVGEPSEPGADAGQETPESAGDGESSESGRAPDGEAPAGEGEGEGESKGEIADAGEGSA